MTRRKASDRDPHLAREANKYENPIPSREYILEVLEGAKGPMTHEALCDVLGLEDDDAIEALRRRLIAMSRDGQLLNNRRNGYGVIDKMDLVRGRVQGHKEGYGFLVPSDGGDDLYLSYRQMRRVLDGDELLVRETGQDFKGRREGSIVEVLQNNTNQIVGRYFSESGVDFVRPDNPRLSHDFLIPPQAGGNAKAGQFVTVEVTQQPGRRTPPMGRVLEVLGDHMAPGMEIDVAIRSHGIPHLWPSDVQAEARQLAAEVSAEDKLNRIDLRKLPFVTIDGEDARDFDDAVYCEAKKGGGWRLYVAIADVSHYVGVDSSLDREAQTRGNSVYFPDFVVPMLPEALSNGLCSLNPKVDRLAMVCEMTVSTAGRVSGYQFYEAVIYSHARLTYTQVGDALAGDVAEVARPVMQHLQQLHHLYSALRSARTERGAIDFETVETRILFDETRKISQIIPVVRNDAHKMIEECMLAANVCAARFLEKHKIPALYRVHEGPREEKLENLRSFLGELGLSLPGSEEPKPGNYQQLLQMIDGRPDSNLIQTVMLRSLSQAKYQPDNKGHFGLAYSAYAHFTSPIRRYPDLLVHRAIRHVIRSNIESRLVQRVDGAKPIPKARIYPYGVADIVQMGEQSSLTERRADDATRDVTSWLKCEYLQDHVGEVFSGIVVGVTNFGLFVELKDLYVEGLVHITNLPHDYYHFEAAQHRLVGERTGQTFRLGDELKVRVAQVNLDDRKVDLALEDIVSRSRRKKDDKKGKINTEKNRSRLKADEEGKAKPKRKRSGAKKSTPKQGASKQGAVKQGASKPNVSKQNASKQGGAKKAASSKPAVKRGSVEKKLDAKPKAKKAGKDGLMSKAKTAIKAMVNAGRKKGKK